MDYIQCHSPVKDYLQKDGNALVLFIHGPEVVKKDYLKTQEVNNAKAKQNIILKLEESEIAQRRAIVDDDDKPAKEFLGKTLSTLHDMYQDRQEPRYY